MDFRSQAELRQQFIAFHRRMRRMQRIPLGKLHQGVTQSQFVLLHAIYELSRNGTEAPVSALSHVCHMHTPAISRLMKELERDGMIVRRIDPNCRRHILVSLTDKGRAQEQRNWELVQRFWERVFALTPEADFTQLLFLLDRMMDNMEQTLEEFPQSESPGTQET